MRSEDQQVFVNVFLSCSFWILFFIPAYAQLRGHGEIKKFARGKNLFGVTLMLMNPFSEKWSIFQTSENEKIILRLRARALAGATLALIASLFISLLITFKIHDNRQDSLIQEVELQRIQIKNLEKR